MVETRQRRRGRSQRRREGMTLVEILIVVIVMALIASGVAIAVIPSVVEARQRRAQIDVMAVRNAVERYMVSNFDDCPEKLEDLELTGSTRKRDVWGREFIIHCRADSEPLVVSTGRDGIEGTDDDIRSSGAPELDDLVSQ